MSEEYRENIDSTALLIVDELVAYPNDDTKVRVIFSQKRRERSFIIDISLLVLLLGLGSIDDIKEGLVFEFSISQQLYNYLKRVHRKRMTDDLLPPKLSMKNITMEINEHFRIFKKEVEQTEVKPTVYASFWDTELGRMSLSNEDRWFLVMSIEEDEKVELEPKWKEDSDSKRRV